MSLADRLVLLGDGVRLGAKHVGRLLGGAPPRFQGDVEAICRQVTDACWNGTYFQAGAGHLDQFWLRDFAIALEGLLDLGQGERARSCLARALARWSRAGRVTTTIFPGGGVADVFTYASDSLPFLLYALERLDDAGLREAHRALLAGEAARYRERIFDPATGDVRSDRPFSATKDTMRFRSTCYTYTMAAWTSALLRRAGLEDPLDGEALRAALRERFWTGDFYRNDLVTEPPLCSGDANFWPYWCGVAHDPAAQLPRSLAAVRAEGLDRPFPLRYHGRRIPHEEVPLQRFFLPNYQGDSIWTFFTPQWIELVSGVDPELAREHARRYDALVEAHGTWIEVFAPDGERPLTGRLGWSSDRGMLWAASWPRVRRAVGLAQDKGASA